MEEQKSLRIFTNAIKSTRCMLIPAMIDFKYVTGFVMICNRNEQLMSRQIIQVLRTSWNLGKQTRVHIQSPCMNTYLNVMSEHRITQIVKFNIGRWRRDAIDDPFRFGLLGCWFFNNKKRRHRLIVSSWNQRYQYELLAIRLKYKTWSLTFLPRICNGSFCLP